MLWLASKAGKRKTRRSFLKLNCHATTIQKENSKQILVQQERFDHHIIVLIYNITQREFEEQDESLILIQFLAVSDRLVCRCSLSVE